MKRKWLICACLATLLLVSLVLSGCCVSLPLDKIMKLPGKTEFPTADATQPIASVPVEAPTEVPTEATTEAPTEVPTEATQPEPENLLTPTVRRRVNLFLSNFSEQGFESYPTGAYEMLQFGYMYCKINRPEKLGNTNATYYVKKTDMDTFLKDFLGETVPAQDYTGIGPYDGITFENNAYHFQAADGGFFGYFTLVNEMQRNSDGTYDVSFDIYEIDYDDELKNSYYDLTSQQAAASDQFTRYGSGSATIRDHIRSTGKESYQLIRYELD